MYWVEVERRKWKLLPTYSPFLVHLYMRKLHRGEKKLWDALQGITVFSNGICRCPCPKLMLGAGNTEGQVIMSQGEVI